MNENMKLWNAVCDTDPKHIKNISYGKRKFTAINAQYQLKLATEQWGKFGETWGIKEEKFEFIEIKDKVFLVYNARFYYPNGEFPIHSSMLAISEKGIADEDCYKKIATDALTKGLSKLGFNADVFLGRFDGNKYVKDEPQEEISQNLAEQKQKAIKLLNSLNLEEDVRTKWSRNIQTATEKTIEGIIKMLTKMGEQR
jgi:hypothetical protein